MDVFHSRARRVVRPGLFGGALLAALAFASPVLSAGKPDPAVEPECRARGTVFRHAEELADIAAEWKRRQPLRIVAIGSSSTAGIGASSPALSYPAQLRDMLGRTLEGRSVSVANLGIGGETAEATVERLKAVLATDPDLVLWQVGTNDALKGGDEAGFRRLVENGIAAARAADVGILLIDPQDFPGMRDRATYERYVGLVRAVADEFRVPLLSRYALMRDWAQDSAQHLARMLSQDSFHMSDRGYGCLAQHLSSALAAAVHDAGEAAPATLADKVRSVTSAAVGHRTRD